ncbi:MAG: sorbosone dehydrogenase family protein [Acidobacteriota bacterium]
MSGSRHAGCAATAVAAAAVVAVLAGCTATERGPERPPAPGGVTVPDGLVIEIVHAGVGRARHLAVRDNGDVYVRLRAGDAGVVALRDEDGDGVYEREERFDDTHGTGIAIAGDLLYVSSDVAVWRYRLPDDGGLVPAGEPELVVGGFPDQRQHAAKSLALGADDALYVNVGAPSNACQERDRKPGVPGLDPCPLLDQGGGIWRFSASATGQRFEDGRRVATGLRNCVALAWDGETGAPWCVMHGRDQLDALWPEFYDAEDNAELPAEEMHRIVPGGDYGWPYTYWDGGRGARMVAPEYGGDGRTEDTSGRHPAPAVAFPAHWAPNALLFARADGLPERFRNGAFVAFHGSWNRAPLPQAGYNVAFVPRNADGSFGPGWEVFADGFAGPEPVRRPGQARWRPMGLAETPGGELLIVDSVRGTLFRVRRAG